MPLEEPYGVFISYKRENSPWMKVLAENLEAAGRRPFLDDWRLVPGQRLDQSLWQALQRSRTGVLVATPEAAEFGWVQEEDPNFRWVAITFGDLSGFPSVSPTRRKPPNNRYRPPQTILFLEKLDD